MNDSSNMDRRDFLRRAALASGALAFGPSGSRRLSKRGTVALVIDPSDPVASSPPAASAARELEQALENAGLTVRRHDRIEHSAAGELCVIGSGGTASIASALLKAVGVSLPDGPESLALLSTTSHNRPVLLACGADDRGLAYAMSELTDRISLAPRPDTALRIDKPIIERPANAVRGVMRQFTCELLDKPWFYDREMWPRYLSMLATQRFNRFHLAFGFGYDNLRQVADSYFLFLYPFLLAVPGYPVRCTNLSDAERDLNLATLRFISDQTVARGVEFQLGIWTHGYGWPNGPRVKNMIEGLTPETHAPYCRDALTAVLRACPAISSVALRIHGESGVAEGSYDFWKTIFDGVKRCGRKVEIDMHAKGIDTTMIDNALATGLPVNTSPKYSAEHLGMPYHQTAIRELEMRVPGHKGAGLMTLSEGQRVFTRYGYADLLRDDRSYTVRHRVFSGTQRLLLWSDPVFASAYSRAFQFCGSTGADLMEPLTCRGRRGTGVPGSRAGYADSHLEPRWDWQKYAHWYRVLGRLLYDPETAPEVWQRPFGSGARAAAWESGLAHASRILPIVTTAHLPSAACDAYWPEIYWNQPMLGDLHGNPYSDTPSPKTFQNVSPLDPQMFSRMSDFAAELLAGERSAKYSPAEVAQWLEELARHVEEDLRSAGKPESVEMLRLTIDVYIQAGLGRFFAAKFRSGVLYSIYERTADRGALEGALAEYRRARAAWAMLTDRSRGVYAADLSASDNPSERGQWRDRLAEIDRDIGRMQERLASATPASDPSVAEAVRAALAPQRREPVPCHHEPPAGFHPKEAVAIELTVEKGRLLASPPRLYYRRVNQAERFETLTMEAGGGVYQVGIPVIYRASIPANFTDSPYPLMYYFELRERPGKAWLYPGFKADLTNQPYFVLRRI
ncbi:MAG TPA: twin-arginine translocation signal domain-containing protein [Blastocatellia bacterium]|nr:twin-arginine translocation signal domain-containing protein [Blastocatellia bacterium]